MQRYRSHKFFFPAEKITLLIASSNCNCCVCVHATKWRQHKVVLTSCLCTRVANCYNVQTSIYNRYFSEVSLKSTGLIDQLLYLCNISVNLLSVCEHNYSEPMIGQLEFRFYTNLIQATAQQCLRVSRLHTGP